MSEIESLHKQENGTILIEIKLSSILQMFNSFDPAPFREKELDSDAEKYIVNIVNDFPAKTQFKLIFYLPPELAAREEAKKIAPAIHNHFRYKMLVADQKYRSRFRHGRGAMLISLGFLPIALFVRFLIASYSSELFAQVARRHPAHHRVGCHVGACDHIALRALADHPDEKDVREDQQHGA